MSLTYLQNYDTVEVYNRGAIQFLRSFIRCSCLIFLLNLNSGRSANKVAKSDEVGSIAVAPK